jgi:hypothetical protein
MNFKTINRQLTDRLLSKIEARQFLSIYQFTSTSIRSTMEVITDEIKEMTRDIPLD